MQQVPERLAPPRPLRFQWLGILAALAVLAMAAPARSDPPDPPGARGGTLQWQGGWRVPDSAGAGPAWSALDGAQDWGDWGGRGGRRLRLFMSPAPGLRLGARAGFRQPAGAELGARVGGLRVVVALEFDF